VHARRGNAAGVRAQTGKALDELTPFRPWYLGLDTEAIVRDLHRLADATTEAAGIAPEHSLTGIFPSRLEFRADFVRGDEPESCTPE
jgi:hypothetical protein